MIITEDSDSMSVSGSGSGSGCSSASGPGSGSISASGGFYFSNSTLKTHLDDRQPQKILIDVGGLEENPLYEVAKLG